MMETLYYTIVLIHFLPLLALVIMFVVLLWVVLDL